MENIHKVCSTKFWEEFCKMRFVELKTRLNPKAALIHAFEYYPGKNLMIMMTQRLFKKFDELNDVCRNEEKQSKEQENAKNDIVVYDLYENEDIDKCEHYGKAVFQLIRGAWLMTEFYSKTYKYEAHLENEADLIILLS